MIYEAEDLPSLFDKITEDPFNNYKGFGSNMLFADTKGNIGYHLIISAPVRKEKTPFIGSRILNGTTTKFDWTGELMPQSAMPKSLNPKKGYLATANNRQTSDHAISDIGACINSPGRILRIDEILREGIASGKKFKLEDLAAIQQDVTDVVARRMMPFILDMAKDEKHFEQLKPLQKHDLRDALMIL